MVSAPATAILPLVDVADEPILGRIGSVVAFGRERGVGIATYDDAGARPAVSPMGRGCAWIECQ